MNYYWFNMQEILQKAKEIVLFKKQRSYNGKVKRAL